MNNDKVKEYLKNKEKQMEECQHLFLKIKEGKSYYGFHSSDYEHEPCVVTCLKCGLTNRFIEMNSIEKECNMMLRCRNPYYSGFIEVNDRIFRKQYRHAWQRCGKDFDESVFNLISDEVWNVNHPMLLYNIAKIIKPEADNMEIFDIMKKLYEIETPTERVELNNIGQAQELIDRYKNIKVRVLKYENK